MVWVWGRLDVGVVEGGHGHGGGRSESGGVVGGGTGRAAVVDGFVVHNV